jgi:GT2 family glycosyltransferase
VTQDRAAPLDRIDVSVVLPVRNEASHVEAVLSDLLAQDLAPGRFEVLVVDGRSEDDTRARVEAVAAREPRVRLLDNPRRLSSAARAEGVAAARGRFVVFVDGHCRVRSRALLSDTVALFERTGADCLARPQPLEPSGGSGRGGLVARAVAAARHSPFGHSRVSEIYGDREGPSSPVSSGASYRREVFARVGTFDASFDACEDVELNWRVERAGLSCWTSPRLAVSYEPRGTLSGLLRQMVRYGRGRARLHRKHPAAFTLESLVPAAFALGLPLLVAAPFLPRPLALAAVAPYALYAVLSLVASALAAARRGWALLPLLPLAFLCVHAGLGWGYVLGRLEPRPALPAPSPPAAPPVEAFGDAAGDARTPSAAPAAREAAP